MSTVRLAVISDIHYASPAEAARGRTMFDPISPLRRAIVLQYRHWLWMRDQFAHNHLLDRFLHEATDADVVVANGDYSCDTAHVGVCDNATFASASICLGKLRDTFGSKLHAIIGDHELGKTMFGAEEGGLRLASYERTTQELELAPVWRYEIGRYVLLGVTSTLLAFSIYEGETLPEELPGWREHIESHRAELHRHLAKLDSQQRVLLFCHDPTALPFLARDERVRARLSQVECTIVGHLHSPAILRAAGWLAGLPPIRFLGHTTKAQHCAAEARSWNEFRLRLCPSPSGMQLFKDGGWLSIDLDPEGRTPARIEFHPLPWTA